MNKIISCFECFYSMFGKCPVNGHKGNATCLLKAKSYFDMCREDLEEATEEMYRKALKDAAQLYHIRMDYIENIFKEKEKLKNNEQTLGQLQD